MKLWTIEVSREQYLTAYVEAETAEEAFELLKREFDDDDHFPAYWGPTFGEPREVTERPEEASMLVYGEGDRTPAEWWAEHEERLAELRRTPGTTEYREAVEAAGQQRLPA